MVLAEPYSGTIRAEFRGAKDAGAVAMIGKALAQNKVSTVIVMNMASRYISSPDNLTQEEVDSFSGLVRALLEARDTMDSQHVMRKNLLVVIANKLNDLPPWFYLQNPNAKSIAISEPSKEERERLVMGGNFASFFARDVYEADRPAYEKDPESLHKLQERFVALTEGMSFTELNGLRKLCKKERLHIHEMSTVVDLYKYGIRENPWKNLDLEEIRQAAVRFEERVKGQPAAQNKTLDIVKRAITGLSGLQGSSHGRPKGVLFFAGPTGTGKTLAFLLPIIEKIKLQAAVTQALVITPTRELAIQIAKVAQSLAAAADISSLVIFGGQDIERQKQKLRRHPQLIIGTPGRLLDHLRRQTIDLSQVNKVVLDEADEMMRLGFIEDVETLLQATAGDRQLMLFSATMPDRVKALSARYMNAPQNLEIKSEHVTLDAIDQVIIDTREETKIDKLCEIINQEQPYLAMVFCHTKQRAHMVTMALAARGYLVDELHGDLSQVQRTLVLKRFRKAELQILCATDIAARGLDIPAVDYVINLDFPESAQVYQHRAGRTARAGRKGAVITLIDFKEAVKLEQLGKKLGIEFERLPHAKAAVPAKKGKQTRQHGPRAARPARKHNK